MHEPKSLYDVILVDEAQDFPSAFLRMCFEMLTQERRLVYAYDELQSLTGTGVPEPEVIFGEQAPGVPRVSLNATAYDLGARRDVVLEKCYRNSRPILVTAHAIGFGIFRTPERSVDTGLVQMFGQPDRWRDIGYHVSDGQLVAGSFVGLQRSPASSPKFLEEHSPIADLVSDHKFDSFEEQNTWVAQQIKQDLDEGELRHDDIMVISPNPFSARKKLSPLRRILLDLGVENHLAGVDSSADVFFAQNKDSITFTGINRAKGNEAGMVYIVNCEEDIRSGANQAVIRNRLFTAITRSKAWVRVCGVGEGMNVLQQEFKAVRAADYKLEFTYPSPEQLQRLRIVHREVSGAARGTISKADRSMRDLIEGIQQGDIFAEDLDPEVMANLRRIIGSVD